MTAYSPVNVSAMDEGYGATTVGTVVTVITPNVGGDSIALTGDNMTLRFATSGTAATVTFDSVDLSNFGQDQDVTCVLSATQVKYVKFNANATRFKQQSGNVGSVNLTYTSVTGLTIEASYDS